MSQFVFKMPDLGEGTVEAEIVAWHTQPGAEVAEDQIIVEVMTDKAAVEVPAPVSGRVVSITGAPGDKIAVGSPLIVFETNGARAPAANAPPASAATASNSAQRRRRLRPRGVPTIPAVSSADEGKSGAGGRSGARRSGHGLAGQSAPRARSRHRPHTHCGLRSRRTHRARRFDRRRCRRGIGSNGGDAAEVRKMPAPRRRGGGRRRANHRNQSDRHAPVDCRAHERSEAQHPAFRLCRGSGRHGARSPAAAFERESRRRANRLSPTCR